MGVANASPRPLALLVLPLLVLTLSAAVLAAAWPRLQASLAYLPVDTAINRQWDGVPVASEQLQPLIERTLEALQLHEHYRYRDGLSLLHYLQALSSADDSRARQGALQASAAAALESLRAAPMQPAAWLRVATAGTALGWPSERVLPPLLMSVYTGRVEPKLLSLRLRLLYRWQRGMDDGARRLLLSQTLLAWRQQPRALVGDILAGHVPYAGVAEVLAPAHPGILAELDQSIVRLAR